MAPPAGPVLLVDVSPRLDAQSDVVSHGRTQASLNRSPRVDTAAATAAAMSILWEARGSVRLKCSEQIRYSTARKEFVQRSSLRIDLTSSVRNVAGTASGFLSWSCRVDAPAGVYRLGLWMHCSSSVLKVSASTTNLSPFVDDGDVTGRRGPLLLFLIVR